MKLFRKIVDERQDLEMMRVERISFWLMFFGLFAAIFVQLIVFDFSLKEVAGETIILMTGSIYSLIGYIRRGCWDYFTKPGMKSYIIYSLAAGIVFGIIALLKLYLNDVPLAYSVLITAIYFACVFVLVFLTLLLFGNITKKRQEKLQQKYADDK